MAFYEATFICRQDMSKQDVTKLMDSYGNIVEQSGGKVIKNEYWGLRSLAYKVGKSRKGHYNMLGLDASPAAIKEVERQARLSEEVLRNLTVRVEAIDKDPSPILRNTRDDSDEPYTPKVED